MKRFGWIMVLVFLLGCQRQTPLIQLETVDRIVMMMPDGNHVGTLSIKEVNTPIPVQTLLEIFEQAKLEGRVRDEELDLVPGRYFIFYNEDEIVGTLIFNGDHCQRVWHHWGWFDVSYQGITPDDFYALYTQEAQVIDNK